MRETREAYRNVIGKLKRDLLGRYGCKWEDTIKTDLRQSIRVWIGLNWLRIGSNGKLW
jgi:hypothetical protein